MRVRVLIVDDDFRVAAVHAAVAGAVPGCEVIAQATTLAQAREALPRSDLVVADEYLPDGSGTELVGAGDASVLLVSAADDADTVRRALVRGAIGYIVKPFEMRVLTERITAYVRFRQSLAAEGRLLQVEIDAQLGMLRPRLDPGAPAKGRSAVTASAVADLLRDSGRPHTVMAVADAIGISRATARRYLADLVAAGEVELLLRYGTAGRPQHSYIWSR
ncbi:two-component system CitB family response regulator [Kineosphaera limosa]|uniref:response regulator n=1 Tax=Kineosphaera limosa TaxID=111564 RepID=UPI0002D9E232|nr:response regulator [Kineosphaera limosa]NYE02441.1 two-component system CitB family response regulator [Kineosphaera limosa]